MNLYLLLFGAGPIAAVVILVLWMRSACPHPAEDPQDTVRQLISDQAREDMRAAIREIRRSRSGDDAVWLSELRQYPNIEKGL